MNSLRWKLQLQMFLCTRCCHWFEIALRCLKMKMWLYFITLQYANLSCYKLETYWNLEKQFPCGERKPKSFITVSDYTIKIYFYIFAILYCVKKYRISENTIFFLAVLCCFQKKRIKLFQTGGVLLSLVASHLWCSNTASTPLLTTSCMGGSDWAGLPGAKL